MWSFGTTMTMAKDKESPAPAQAPAPPPPQAAQPPVATVAAKPSIFSERSMKQLGVFFAGAGFLALSTLITRRAVAHKIKATVPRFYEHSHGPQRKLDTDNSLIAVEALGFATLNTMSFGIMFTGGLAWAFDVSNIDDLRRLARKHVGPAGGQTDEEGEREVEEWIASVMSRIKNEDKKGESKEEPPKAK